MDRQFRKTVGAVLIGGVLACGGALADNHEEEGGGLLSMTKIKIQVGHRDAFNTAMTAYKDCYVENEGKDGWSVWVDMRSWEYWVVSSMDNWAKLDEQDEIDEKCWDETGAEMMKHIAEFGTSYARHLADWSGNADNYNVVRLHQFRVDENRDFRDTVGAITKILKDDDHEHMGTWYEMIAENAYEPNYFVVEHFENFAAMDEDRPGAYARVKEAEGEERADELWDQFGDSLHDDWEYTTHMLRRVSSLGYSPSDD
jgi:hypothetical protein